MSAVIFLFKLCVPSDLCTKSLCSHCSEWVVSVNQECHFNLLQKQGESWCREKWVCQENELPSDQDNAGGMPH